MTLSSIRTGRAITATYFDDISAVSSVNGDELCYDYPIRCLSFQGQVVSGTPVGEMKLQMSIIDGVWSDLAGCQPITVDLGTNTEFMFLVPEQSFYAGKLRMVWTAGSGSTGIIKVLSRVMPW